MFGKSLFQSVLDRLDADDVKETMETESIAIRGLKASLAFDTERTTGQASVHQAYADTAGPETPAPKASARPAPPGPEPSPPPTTPPKPRPAYLDRLTPAEVAADLGLLPTDTPAVLAEKRRAFALANHPDRFAPQDRAAATRRMGIANMLVDEAQRRVIQRARRTTARSGDPSPAPDRTRKTGG